MVGMIGIILALLLGFGPSDGVTVHLRNGKAVHGQLLQETSKFVLLEIDLGQLLVQRKNIKSMVKDPAEGTSGARNSTSAVPPKEEMTPSHPKGGTTPKENPSGAKAVPAVPSGIAPTNHSAKRVPYRSNIELEPTHKEPATRDPLQDWTLPLQSGRLLDRYTWFYDMELPTQISVGFALLLLLWGGFLLGGRILGVDSINGKRAFAATSLWFVLLVGVLLIPNPSLIIIGVLLFLLLVAWFISSRGVLGLGWFHSFVLLVLGGFGLSLVALVVEVSESLISL